MRDYLHRLIGPRSRINEPPSLWKATMDPFRYAAKLRSGEVVEFEAATIDGEWVRLYAGGHPPYEERFPSGVFGFPCPRGVDVRIEDIVWCVDAPLGS